MRKKTTPANGVINNYNRGELHNKKGFWDTNENCRFKTDNYNLFGVKTGKLIREIKPSQSQHWNFPNMDNIILRSNHKLFYNIKLFFKKITTACLK